MAAQLKDKGHPALQTVRADRFAHVLAACQTRREPSDALRKLIADGKKSLHQG